MFKAGDVVQLKSGGPKMTVLRLIGEMGSNQDAMVDRLLKVQKSLKDGDPICQWFAGNELKSDAFKEEVLGVEHS